MKDAKQRLEKHLLKQFRKGNTQGFTQRGVIVRGQDLIVSAWVEQAKAEGYLIRATPKHIELFTRTRNNEVSHA